ncbi:MULTISPECIES: tripartite tricarboxylate transporter TctB family protein [unclassified Oceanispirochaeta]|uniref:tripartite tricarboxylate transporter TctB family protein n=1 Tax=unclassified Oceanispirochaeta TaxID=2635722 RepID=UPI0011C064D7|nr:tripartite tricarboxylate transporter TctB family protein [Oceanispirochaeta sp. M1]MBF9015318.1 tripartite tricarboxylate transporter TctB family protein [Oceanispirochaeta sp. M2]NPD71776.1 tripartite tricarboxylate transporter TctB family protein [Oceanispirochaeta sp. M1]
MSLSVLPSLLFLLLGLVYTSATLMLPEASVGRAFEPKIFPLMLGIILISMSISLLIRELKEQKETEKKEPSDVPFFKEAGFKKIGLTCLASIVYALLFDKAGYVISTIIFLELELLLFNGAKNWKINTAVAVLFSLFIYIVFSKLLGVYLPLTPGIWV